MGYSLLIMFPPEEAAILQMRSELMVTLRKFIERKKLTQTQAAELLGISQSRVSDLIKRQVGEV
jgi:predicted XRE-type DNA-binding protein